MAEERSSAAGSGDVSEALASASRLLAVDPARAAEVAKEILDVVPGHPAAALLLAVARRSAGDAQAAASLLENLTRERPDWAVPHYELARTLAVLGRQADSRAALRRAVAAKPDYAWRALADLLSLKGDRAGAERAHARQIEASLEDPSVVAAAAAVRENRLPDAERILREHLQRYPNEVEALRMLADVGARVGRFSEAEQLLARTLALAPKYTEARHDYAVVLHRQDKFVEARVEAERLLAVDPAEPRFHNIHAAVLVRAGEYERAIRIQRELLSKHPNHPKIWMIAGNTLKTAGHYDESIAAYRKSIALAPHLGESYWSLANLKVFRFGPDEIEAMLAQLARHDLSDEDRWHFEFALGKALEDARAHEESFAHYQRGNALRRSAAPYDADDMSARVGRSRTTLTRSFFAQRAGWGADASDPIFIVGMPRSGSTLLEQILGSHSAVEPTMELPDVLSIVRELCDSRSPSAVGTYPHVLATIGADDARALGERYIAQTRVRRKKAAPYFIDKMPNNFEHIGLIHLMLPNAKIIDARRHPLACGFSNFKQHFVRGQHFSYSLADIGRYYRDYVELMAHFDDVLPGRIHRVFYEDLIDDMESEVRRLLEHCGLPFEARCLEFHANTRPVMSASSEQVRQPIYRDSLEAWRPYEPWLEPLKDALGPVLAAYPDVPKF